MFKLGLTYQFFFLAETVVQRSEKGFVENSNKEHKV
jgi:hypothetical protein